MSYTREEWCKEFLFAIGNTAPSQKTLLWTIAWTKVESAPPGAMFNLLNTTERMPGSTDYNSVGVQNFTSFAQGIDANTIVLENGLYPDLLNALRNNLEGALGFVNGVISGNILRQLNTWCGGCNYGYTILQLIGQGLLDQFPGNETPMVNPNMQQAAFNTWQSFIDPLTKAPVRDDTGIFKAWFALYMSGNLMHPPEGPEFSTVTWDGVPVQAQNFGIDRAEWDLVTSTIKWYKNAKTS